jgi:hypothetical protein
MQGLILQNVKGTADFAFSPFTIDTSAGSLNVQITGSWCDRRCGAAAGLMRQRAIVLIDRPQSRCDE